MKHEFWPDFVSIFREEAQILEWKDNEVEGNDKGMNQFELFLKDFDTSF
jgi:hypothetical protein